VKFGGAAKVQLSAEPTVDWLMRDPTCGKRGMQQQSEEWLRARKGRVTVSNVERNPAPSCRRSYRSAIHAKPSRLPR